MAAAAAARHLQVLGIDLEQLRRRRERRARLAAADGRHLACPNATFPRCRIATSARHSAAWSAAFTLTAFSASRVRANRSASRPASRRAAWRRAAA